ncbi:MAG: hypothetical protein R2838_00570 [Caldilineaceae bacterium]
MHTVPTLSDWRTVECRFPAELWDDVRGRPSTCWWSCAQCHPQHHRLSGRHPSWMCAPTARRSDRFEPNDFA